MDAMTKGKIFKDKKKLKRCKNYLIFLQFSRKYVYVRHFNILKFAVKTARIISVFPVI